MPIDNINIVVELMLGNHGQPPVAGLLFIFAINRLSLNVKMT